MRIATVNAVVPVLDEEATVGSVVTGLLEHGVDKVIVVDNGSADGTSNAARAAGATVISEPRRGYGSACLAGMAALEEPDIVVFADGDGCDDPKDLPALIEPITSHLADMVIGSRLSGRLDPGALPMRSRVGNRIASIMLRLMYGQKTSDLGPFRAIALESLRALRMRDTGFGWTAEMQAKAALVGLRVTETAVHYRRRSAGQSKITGNARASLVAGWIIVKTLLLTRVRARHLVGAEHAQEQEENVCERQCY